MNSFDHILFIGFGGPEKPEDVWPFLKEVTRGIPIPEERLKDVAHHYEAIGGSSPYNRYTLKLLQKIQENLESKDIALPVFLGMRNWHPFLKDTLAEIERKGYEKGLGIILAPHRSDTSFEKYLRNLEEAKTLAKAENIQYEFLRPWFDHKGFIEAQTDEVQKILDPLNAEEKAKTYVIFSAHSIPVEMAGKSRYVEEFHISSQRVARELKIENWNIAYQSRSGNPRQPWLEPGVVAVLRGLSNKGFKNVLLVPVGFLSDNAEVLYDLDIEAKQEAEKCGLKYLRASTVMDHPLFAKMFADLIAEHCHPCRL